MSKFLKTHKQALVDGELPNHPTHKNPRNPVLSRELGYKLKHGKEIIDSDEPPWDTSEDEK